jgi:predicted secreted protein
MLFYLFFAETQRVLPKKTNRKTCKKIAPCYIVLTNVEPFIGSKTYVSSRAFKRQFSECSNMCKKTHFKRRLEAGKDVFNVKAPSKQKDYYIHLVNLEHEQARKSKQKIVQFPDLKYLMEKHELKMSKKTASPEKKTLNRVRRIITKLPKDFVIRPNSPNLQEEVSVENREALSSEELEAFNARMAARKHKLELSSLKKLIGIKRSMNKQSKKCRKTKKMV